MQAPAPKIKIMFTFHFTDMTCEIESFFVDILDSLYGVLFIFTQEGLWYPVGTRQMNPNSIYIWFNDVLGVNILNHLKIVVELSLLFKVGVVLFIIIH